MFSCWPVAGDCLPACRRFAVLPAAGHSRRMGRPKLLLPWGTGTLIEHVLRQYLALPLEAVVVVVRPGDEALARRVRAAGALVCQPPQCPGEMKESVQWGLRYLQQHYAPGPEDLWLLSPCDMPGITAELIARVASYYRPEVPEVVLPICGKRRGHPVVLPWQAAAEVFRLGAGEGINALVACWPQCLVPVAAGGAFCDVDTPEAYRRVGGGDGAGER